MYHHSNRYRILRLFFDHPNRRFQLREIGRELKLSLPSVRNHVHALFDEGFLDEIEEGVYKGYILAKNSKTRVYKRNDMLARLEENGILDTIEEKTRPNCIILYGSAVEGRDDERGDVDLYVQAKTAKIDLKPFEKELNRKISLLFEPDSKKLNKELLNNLANGMTLRGYLKVI